MHDGIEGLEDKRRLSQSWEPCLRVEERCMERYGYEYELDIEAERATRN